MEKRFVITWTIDEFAETPQEAMPHAGNDDTLATVFDVEELDVNGKTVSKVQIDILDENDLDIEEDEDWNKLIRSGAIKKV